MGLSEVRIRQIEASETIGVMPRAFRKLAAGLAVSLEELGRMLSGDPAAVEPQSNVRAVDVREVAGEDRMRAVPILGRVPGGLFEDPRIYEGLTMEREGFVVAPVGDTRAFAMVVDGDSMEPKYASGDLVVCKALDPERAMIVDGRDYAVQMDGDNFYEICLKRLWNHPKEGPVLVVARPLNPMTRPREKVIARHKISRLGQVWMVFPR